MKQQEIKEKQFMTERILNIIKEWDTMYYPNGVGSVIHHIDSSNYNSLAKEIVAELRSEELTLTKKRFKSNR